MLFSSPRRYLTRTSICAYRPDDVVIPKRSTPPARIILPKLPIPVSKALSVSSAPESPEDHSPVTIITSEVIVQITIVSRKTSNIPRIPCLIGWSVFADA